MFSFKNIQEYHSALAREEITCREVIKYYLDRIQESSSLNAFVKVFEEEAIYRAGELDQIRQSGVPMGKLHGVVVSLKDVISYKNHPVSASSAILKDFKAVYSATVVDRLLKEGAIIIGTCNCDEFAMGNTNENSVYGVVRNPFDKNKVAGGSSGGSAAAVSAGLCMISMGSDTGGSVRQPADFCGVAGFKPTYGANSRHGLIAYASSFDQIGIIGNNIADIQLVFDVISGPDNFDSTALQQKIILEGPKEISKMRIGVFTDALNHPSLDPEIRLAVLKTVDDLKLNGVLVDKINFDLLDYIVPAYYVLTTAEASSNLSRYDGVRYGHLSPARADELEIFYKKNRSEGFGKEVKKRIILGTYVLSEGYFDAYFTKAQQVRNLLVKESEEIFKKYDAVLMPTVPHTAFETGNIAKDQVSAYLADIFTVYANLTGIPALSLPLYRHSNGMPFGIQILTGKKDEVNLFRLADYLNSINKQYRK